MAKRPFVKEEDARKAAEAVFFAQICGALLLLPPIINLFNKRLSLFGVPLEVLYLFLVWIVLIASAVVISASVPRASADEQLGEEPAQPTNESGKEGG
ncbi:MAG TPA: hypothetical protein VF226_17585 [Hyphomicrobiaceae bacterium]|jgi:heme/copper-type cytochrome/quinol oxidase subunit 1